MGQELRVRKIIETFPNNKIIILPQTIFYGEDEESKKQFELSKKIYGKHKDLHIFAREEISYNIMKKAYKKNNIYLVPDIVLYNNDRKESYERKGITFLIRSDKEKSISNKEMKRIIDQAKKISDVNITDTIIQQKVMSKERKKVLEKKLKELSKSKLVITDRLHGMVFAKITRTPCIVLSNCNHKVKGVYNWVKDLPYIYYSENIDDAIEHMKEFYKTKTSMYKEKSFKEEFEKLVEVIK